MTEDQATPAEQLQQALAEIQLSLSHEKQQALLDYLGLIQKWNQVYNLSAIRDPQTMLSHHLFDCLAIVPLFDRLTTSIEEGRVRILDVGSGAGLPGLVLAICRPEWHIETIDTVGKKAAFMQQVALQLGLKNVVVHHNRVEKLQAQHAATYSHITSRAFASLGDFVTLTKGLLRPGGLYVAMKAKVLETKDLQALPIPRRDIAIHPIQVPFLQAERHVVVMPDPAATSPAV